MALKKDLENLSKDLNSFFSYYEQRIDSSSHLNFSTFGGIKLDNPYSLEFFEKKVEDDEEIEVYHDGYYNITITKSCNLFLDIRKELISKIDINLEDDVVAKVLLVGERDSFIDISTFLSRNSKLDFSELILEPRYFYFQSNLERNSKIDLYGRYLSKHNCFIYNEVNHLEEESKSMLDVKGVCKEKGRTINDGNVKVYYGAKSSISDQNMLNYLIGEESSVESEPMLEIYDNRVECSHSSSISNIDKYLITYLNSRGIETHVAEKMVIEGLFYQLPFPIYKYETLLKKYL